MSDPSAAFHSPTRTSSDLERVQRMALPVALGFLLAVPESAGSLGLAVQRSAACPEPSPVAPDQRALAEPDRFRCHSAAPMMLVVAAIGPSIGIGTLAIAAPSL